jgi:hypothetical protein
MNIYPNIENIFPVAKTMLVSKAKKLDLWMNGH